MTPVAFSLDGDPALTRPALLYPADRATRYGALLVLAHGAGAGQSSPWMVRYARALSERGADVVTFNFPYLEAGRRAPDRAPVLEAAFRAVIAAAAAHRHVEAARVFIGGKSMGGRMATHLAADPDSWPAGPALDGVVVFGYPLKPPGGFRVSPDRVSHLSRIAVPVLIVQGTRDNFGGPEALRDAIAAAGHPPITVQAVEGGDHSLAVRASAAGGQVGTDEQVWQVVTAFMHGGPAPATS